MALVWSMVLRKMPWNALPLFGYHPLMQVSSLQAAPSRFLPLTYLAHCSPSGSCSSLNPSSFFNQRTRQHKKPQV